MAAVGLQHVKPPLFPLEGIPRFGDILGLLHHPAAHGAGVRVSDLLIQRVLQLVQRRIAKDQQRAVLAVSDIDLHLIVLVPNFAHQFLQNILHGDDTSGAAVLVRHHGHLAAGALHQLQRRADLRRFRHEQGLLHQLLQGAGALLQPVEEILLVQNAHDMIQRFVIHRQTGVLAFLQNRHHFLLRGVQRHALHPDPGREDIRQAAVVKQLDTVFQQVALVLVHAALLLHLVHQRQQLVLREGTVFFEMEHAAQQLFPPGKHRVDGLEHHQQHPHDRRYGHGEIFRHFLGDALGRDLAEDQHHHRAHDR